MLSDGCGRDITYLRISLTDKCNLRCRYCLPPEGVVPMAHKELLTFEEIDRFVGILYREGLRKVRLTGGEPLVRKNVEELCRMLKKDREDLSLSITTNGILFADKAEALKKAGVDHVNISLDTLDPERFAMITGKDQLHEVLRGIEKAKELQFTLKINCVPVKELNADQIKALLVLAKENDLDLRFIELMPIGCGKAFTPIYSDELKEMIDQWYGMPKPIKTDIHSPAVLYSYPGFAGRVGFISPRSHKFCRYCNRIRLTAEGYVKLCLQYALGFSVKEKLRGGSTDEEIKEALQQALRKKPAAHQMEQPAGTEKEPLDQRKMVQIGG